MPIRYEDRRISELRSIAKKRGLQTGGTKNNLIKRLRGKRQVRKIKNTRMNKSRASKFERCVMKVKSKQRKSCKQNNYKSKGCYNPWAVCYSSIYK